MSEENVEVVRRGSTPSKVAGCEMALRFLDPEASSPPAKGVALRGRTGRPGAERPTRLRLVSPSA
jgi:hypothetical protein